MNLSGYAKYAWGVLIYNLFVILWGAYVRATGSGAGCGSHWPLCNGEVIPRTGQLTTMIEFTHRLTSGVALLLVLVLFIWGFRKYEKYHPVRLGAVLSLIFIITEALVGAGLVIFEWVADDASTGRAVSIGVHLVNTFLLLASLTLTAWWASGGRKVQLRNQGIFLWLYLAGCIGVVLIGISGAITALGDTLFPIESLQEGIKQDFASSSHFLIRLRIWHPVIATIVGLYLIFISLLLGMFREAKVTRRLAAALSILFLVQLFAGMINLILLAPIWMQLLHLLLADLVWIILILLGANAFSIDPAGLNENVELPAAG